MPIGLYESKFNDRDAQDNKVVVEPEQLENEYLRAKFESQMTKWRAKEKSGWNDESEAITLLPQACWTESQAEEDGPAGRGLDVTTVW